MKKLAYLIGGVAVLLFLIYSSPALAMTKHGDAPVAKKQLRTVKHHAAKGTGTRAAIYARKNKPGFKVRYIEVAKPQPLPKYCNPLILWMGAWLLFILGGIIGAYRYKRGTAREKRASLWELIKEDFKNFFAKFRKGGACQPAI